MKLEMKLEGDREWFQARLKQLGKLGMSMEQLEEELESRMKD